MSQANISPDEWLDVYNDCIELRSQVQKLAKCIKLITGNYGLRIEDINKLLEGIESK